MYKGRWASTAKGWAVVTCLMVTPLAIISLVMAGVIR
jgi:hypothetical protein